MIHGDGCALLIGINNYSEFDRSVGNPEGVSNLLGGVPDASMFWRVCLQLGMKPENIRIAVNPRPEPALFYGATEENFVDTTEAGLRGAMEWLAGKLAGGVAGLLTYSGHGAHSAEQGLLLCPSDTSGAEFSHAIPFRELGAIFPNAENLTVVLDCCHASPAPVPSGRRLSTLGGSGVNPEQCLNEMMVGARVLAACQPGERTQQGDFGGVPHGSFSWAVGAVLDQWRTVREGSNACFDLSYQTLLDKASELLAVLEFAGTPALYGPPGVESLAVMQVGGQAEQTSDTPDAERPLKQMDPGQKQVRLYTMVDIQGAVSNVLVPKQTGSVGGVTYYSGTEYWLNVTTRAPSRSLTVTWADYDWNDPRFPSLGTLSFRMDQSPAWSVTGEPPSASNDFASTSLRVTLEWGLTFGGSGWGGYLKWFNTTGLDNVFAGAMPVGGVILSASTSQPRGYSWYQARVSPM